MDIDFSVVLVSLVAFCGALWLMDNLLNKKARLAAIEQYKSKQGKGKSEDEVANAIGLLSQEPLVIEYAKSFFPVLLIVLVLRSFLVEPFQIPTGSMIPTVEIGDKIGNSIVGHGSASRWSSVPGWTWRRRQVKPSG